MDIKLSDILKKNCLSESLILTKSKFYHFLERQATSNILPVPSVAVYTKCKFDQYFKWQVTTNVKFRQCLQGKVTSNIIINRRIMLKLLEDDMKCQNAFMPSKSIRKTHFLATQKMSALLMHYTLHTGRTTVCK
jgi:hypothetical protein